MSHVSTVAHFIFGMVMKIILYPSLCNAWSRIWWATMVPSIPWWASDWDQPSILINRWNLGYNSVRKSISTKAGRTCTASLHDEDVFSLWLIQELHYLQQVPQLVVLHELPGEGHLSPFCFNEKGHRDTLTALFWEAEASSELLSDDSSTEEEGRSSPQKAAEEAD